MSAKKKPLHMVIRDSQMALEREVSKDYWSWLRSGWEM